MLEPIVIDIFYNYRLYKTYRFIKAPKKLYYNLYYIRLKGFSFKIHIKGTLDNLLKY